MLILETYLLKQKPAGMKESSEIGRYYKLWMEIEGKIIRRNQTF